MTEQNKKSQIQKVFRDELIAQSKDLIQLWTVGKDGMTLFAIAIVHDTLSYYDEAPTDTEGILQENHEMLREYVLSIKDVISKGLLDFSKDPSVGVLHDLNEAFMVIERVSEEDMFLDDISIVEKAISNSPSLFKPFKKQAARLKTVYRHFDDSILEALVNIE